jgi:hypothetical protein
MVLVSRDHIQHHFTGGDTQDHWSLGLRGGRRFLRGHRKAERGNEAGRKDKKVMTAVLAGHEHNCIAQAERQGKVTGGRRGLCLGPPAGYSPFPCPLFLVCQAPE